MVSARSPKIGPRLSVEGTGTLAVGSQENVTPEEGDARGNRADSLAMEDCTGLKLLVRKSDVNWPLALVLATLSQLMPYTWGIIQTSLSLCTPFAHTFCSSVRVQARTSA